MNSSLLSGFSQSENGPVSRISVVHDDLSASQSSRESVILPVMNDSKLPPLTHRAVQLGKAEQWTFEMVDSLTQCVFASLQNWMREREQLLMLKRLLIRCFCEDRELADAWYQREIEAMEASVCVLCDC